VGAPVGRADLRAPERLRPTPSRVRRGVAGAAGATGSGRAPPQAVIAKLATKGPHAAVTRAVLSTPNASATDGRLETFWRPTGIEPQPEQQNVGKLAEGSASEMSENRQPSDDKSANRGDGRNSSVKPANARSAAVADLYRHAAEFAAAGDLEAARVAHESIGRLLGTGGHGSPPRVHL
jgi:hypothetical protein